MIDHVIIGVTDIKSAKEFYEAALAPLGYTLTSTTTGVAVSRAATVSPTSGCVRPRRRHSTHVAFNAENRALVSAFYDAALAAGGKDNGAPGVRAHYHENYYGAFVLDADGHNIEAVCHKPEA